MTRQHGLIAACVVCVAMLGLPSAIASGEETTTGASAGDECLPEQLPGTEAGVLSDAVEVEAEPPGRPEGISDEVHEILLKLEEHYAEIQGFRAKIVSTGYDKNFEEDLQERSGIVYVKKPGLVRLEYKEPTERLYIVNQKQYIEFVKSLKTATVIDRKPGDEKGSWLDLARSAEELEKRNVVTLQNPDEARGERLYKLKFVPRNQLDGPREEMSWWIDARKWLPLRVIIEDESKRQTYVLSEHNTKSRISDKRFDEPKWPADVDVDRDPGR